MKTIRIERNEAHDHSHEFEVDDDFNESDEGALDMLLNREYDSSEWMVLSTPSRQFYRAAVVS